MVIALITEWVIFIVILLFALFCFGGCIESIIRNKNARFPNWVTPILTFILGASALYFALSHIPDNTMKDGGTYYVNISANKDDSKNYHLPALIVKNEYGYFLHELYWPNGGTTTFEGDPTTLKIGKKVYAHDDEDRYWFIELTKDEAPKRGQ